ncbi:MAG: hypothetical protein IPJ06_09040 [Saprospiraceae bacterium]|nr:hypothetical protein [Saprospiraceae bacterium]
MRVVGEIPHPVYKITLFHYQDRWTLQIANGPYQFRTTVMQMPGMDTVEDIQQLVNEAFLLQARDLFAQIHLMTQNRVKEINSGDR